MTRTRVTPLRSAVENVLDVSEAIDALHTKLDGAFDELNRQAREILDDNAMAERLERARRRFSLWRSQ